MKRALSLAAGGIGALALAAVLVMLMGRAGARAPDAVPGGTPWRAEILSHARKLLAGADRTLALLPSGDDVALQHARERLAGAIAALDSVPDTPAAAPPKN